MVISPRAAILLALWTPGCLEGPRLAFENGCDPALDAACRVSGAVELDRGLPPLPEIGPPLDRSVGPGDAALADSTPSPDGPHDSGSDGPPPDTGPSLFECGAGGALLCMVPSDDTYVDSTHPMTAHGDEPKLYMSLDGAARRDMWVRFDLRPLLELGPFNLGQVELSGFEIDVDPGTPNLELNFAPTSWREDTLTWERRPDDGSSPRLRLEGDYIGQRSGVGLTLIMTEALNDMIEAGQTAFAFRQGFQPGTGRGVWTGGAKEGRGSVRLVVRLRDPEEICDEDDLEPNNSLRDATPLDADTELDAVSCPADNDFFSVNLLPGRAIVATLTHAAEGGNLDLALLNGLGRRLATENGGATREVLRYEGDGIYFLQVYSQGLKNTYHLSVRTEAPDAGP